jgi:hypothetical protein
MGLDVYVGSLTRYYSGDWETVVQKWGRENGTPVHVVRPPADPEDAVRDPQRIGPVVLAWRKQLAEALGEHLDGPMVWNESHEAPYFTDKPAWDGYADLLLWAAYAEHPDLRQPEQPPKDFHTDPAYQASNGEGYQTRYPHLLCAGLELWLPCRFTCVFRALTLSGTETTIGSSIELLRQLRRLNADTWKADDAALAQWRQLEAPHASPLEQGARRAFAMLSELAEESVRHRLPMKLDY